MSFREREDAPDSDISPVPVSEFVDDRTGEPMETQANQNTKISRKDHDLNGETCVDDPGIPEWLQEFREKFGG